MRKPLIIAIDGPSGAGKGTVARAIASALGYRHVDSGAMYRAVGWKALRDGVSLDDDVAVAALAAASRIEITSSSVTIDDLDVTREMRTPEIDHAAASVARLPRVRSVLVERQRRARRRRRHRHGRPRHRHGGVPAGRREALPRRVARGTRAATRARSRAHRRARQPLLTSPTCSPQRDESDRTRTASPLYAATDAVLVDTTGKPVDEVVDEVMTW